MKKKTVNVRVRQLVFDVHVYNIETRQEEDININIPKRRTKSVEKEILEYSDKNKGKYVVLSHGEPKHINTVYTLDYDEFLQYVEEHDVPHTSKLAKEDENE